jgi:hypothetical protein
MEPALERKEHCVKLSESNQDLRGQDHGEKRNAEK